MPKNREVYLSIDTETTGLDPNHCQVLEIGAVLDDAEGDLSEKPQFQCYVVHDVIVGEAFALQMNHEILKRIAKRKEFPEATFLAPDEVGPAFDEWLNANLPDPRSNVTPAGKNFASFDRDFLNRLPYFPTKRLRHRAIDAGNLCWYGKNDPKGFELPGSDECMKRCNIDGQCRHRALDDALDVCRIVREQCRPV